MVFLGTHSARFRIVRPLGEGGMGVVYEAYDSVRDARVALKTIREAHGDSVYRLKREFRSLAGIEHPNLVRLYDLFADERSCFFTMELVQGRELTDWIATSAATEDDLAVTLNSRDVFGPKLDAIRFAIDGLCRGLERLHEAGLVHRDLKPSNVLVADDRRVVLLDFGLVADAHAAIQHTHSGAVAGTVAYMAPEQARGESELTTSVDRYAIGAILYELLTGVLPFSGTAVVVLADKVGRDPRRPKAIVPAIPDELDELVMRLLHRDPTIRPTLFEIRKTLVGESVDSRTTQPVSSATSAPPVLGREMELGTILRALEGTASGAANIVLLRGRSGIGKSALIAAACRDAEAVHDAVVLSGRCYEFESIPYKGLDGVVDSMSRYLATLSSSELGLVLPPNLGDLAAIFPVLRRIAPIASAYARRSASAQTPQRIRASGLACLRELLRRISDRRALILAIDDVQWADGDTSRALVELLRDANPPAIVLLLGSRVDSDCPVLEELFGARATVKIDVGRFDLGLAPLDAEATKALLVRELGGSGDQDLVDNLARESRGNPFAACELARFVRDEEGSKQSIGGRTIDELIVERAANLPATARSFLDFIAVAGEPTDEALLRRAAEVLEDDRSITDTLRSRHFIRGIRAGSITLLDTIHDRIRESIANAIDDERRTALHRALALALESAESPPHDRLARHFAAAGDRALGYLHAVAAADEARAGFALRRSAELLSLAIDLAGPEERATTMPRYAEALSSASMFEQSAAAWERASALVVGTEARECRRRAAEAWLYAGRIDHGISMLEESASSVGVAVSGHRYVVLVRAVWERLRLRWRGPRTLLRPTSEIPARTLEQLRTLRAMSLAYTPIDQIRAMPVQTRWLRAVLDSGHGEDLAYAAMVESAMCAFSGNARAFDTAIRLIESSVSFVSAETVETVKLTVQILWENWNGSYRRARELALRVEEISSALPLPDWLRSFVHFGVVFGSGGEIDPNAWARLARFVRDREEASGPSAELRLRPFVAVHDIAVGEGERSIGLASGAAWSGVAHGEFAGRAIAYAYESWARLACGDLSGATEAALEGIRIARNTQLYRFHGARSILLLRLSAAALAHGDARTVRRCLREFGPGGGRLQDAYRAMLRAHDALASRTRARDALVHLASIGRDHGRVQFEAAAEWALGQTLAGVEAMSHRRRAVALVRDTGLVDPDRFFWSILPVGAAPPRRGRLGLIWADDDA